MIRNYFKIAIRTLWKHKLFSFVNIFGLSLSMAVGVLLFSRLKANHDADHFHPKLNQIVRILTQETVDAKQTKWATAPLPLATQIDNTSFVEKTVKVRLGGKHNLQTDNGDVPIEITFSEPSFFDIFGFKLLSGNAQSLSNNPATLFLTGKTAKQIFGNNAAVGQTVQFENLGSFIVSGIIQDPPLQTHLPIEAMCAISAAEMLEKKGIINNSSQNWLDFKTSAIYARLKSDNNLAQLNKTLQNYSRKTDKSNLEFIAQPLEDITPSNTEIQNDNNAGINKSGIITLLFLILSLTILSAFNYISLSLARAFSRAQEIGIRKTIGASRGQIIKQFLVESTLVSLLALLFTMPFVQILMDKIPNISFDFHIDFILILGLLSYGLITGLVAGAFPAWLLSAFQPVQILRKMKNIKILRGVGIYKVLIVIQFSVTIMLMVFFVILTDFERKNSATISSIVPPNVLTLDLKGENYENLQNEIGQLSQVESILATNWYYDALKTGACSVKQNNKIQTIRYVSLDPKTIETEHIKLKFGQNFPQNMPKNIEQFVLVNEAAAKLIESKTTNIVGQSIVMDSTNVQVVGVMPNQIVGHPVPLVFRYLPKEIVALTIKIKPNSELAVTKACQAIWKSNFPQKTANIRNLKERYSGEVALEMMGFFGFFALIVMIIAAMGILGIASYSVEIRTKELGIRKVLGANKATLVWTISKNFGVLILIAGILGIPAGLFCGNLLRNRMGSNVDLGFTNLLTGFGLVAIVGLITVLSQTIRAGQNNPVKVLKTE
jgi:putative ABC transport system permease protein